MCVAGRAPLPGFESWEGVPALRVAESAIDPERAVQEPIWQVLVPWLAQQAADDALALDPCGGAAVARFGDADLRGGGRSG